MLKGQNHKLFSMKLIECLQYSQEILDIGTSKRFAKELRPFEPLFIDKDYIAAGYNPSKVYGKYNCDCHQDITSMDFASNHFDLVFCIDVLEHVHSPLKAMDEIYRVLKSSGILFLTVPFVHGYHGKSGSSPSHETYSDYWRFSHEGLLELAHGFASVDIYPLDGPVEVILDLLGFSRFISIPLVHGFISYISPPSTGKLTSRHLMIAKKSNY